MTSALSTFVAIRFVNDGDADPAVVALAGQVFHFPPEYLATLGSGPGNPGVIWFNPSTPVRGFLRTETDGSRSWVMTSEITPGMKTAILAAPGGLGWINQTLAPGTPLRATVNVARALVQAGVSGADMTDAVTKLVRAGAQNRDAQIAAGG